MRKPWVTWSLFTPFLASVFGSWAWFNTDIGRSGSRPSTLDSGRLPGIWLTARTNIPGYIFIAEPVSESVMKTLGTTNIISGSFYKIDVSNQQSAISDPNSMLTSDLRPLTSESGSRRSTLDSGPPRNDFRLLTSDSNTGPLIPPKQGEGGWTLHCNEASNI